MPAPPLIAVVDDDASACEAMVALVKSMDFRAVGFRTADDFLHSDSLDYSDFLIVDMRMEGMGGIELYKRLVGAGRKLPTILVTAYPDEITRRHARDIGIGFYLSKPCKPEELLCCLAALGGG